MASTWGDGAELFAAGLQPDDAQRPSSEAQDDLRLVMSARAGDREAFGRLYDRYAPMVHGVLMARVPFSEVDDLLHDVFLQAMPRLHALRDISRFGAWLAAIARNRANDYHRQSVAEVELPEDLPEGPSNDAKSGASPSPEAALVLAAINTLSETYRETLILRLVEGMTGPEIAARTGMTHGSVRVNLHRGMQQLREKLQANALPAKNVGGAKVRQVRHE